ncbi:MAG: hypothetical protein ABI807_11200 [Sporichthyaceae bacterium]
MASYWLVDPDPPAPVLTVLELDDGGYVEVARVTRRRVMEGDPPVRRDGPAE